MSDNAEIYEAILKSCVPYSLKLGGTAYAPIGGVVTDFYVTPSDPMALRKQLSEAFDEAGLKAAGLLRKTSEPGWVWAYPFEDYLGGSQILFALRAANGQPAFDIATERGCLSFRNLPVLAVLDHFGMQPGQNQHYLFVTATLADAAFFWRIGLAAICGAGLAHLQQPWIDRFCKKLIFHKGYPPTGCLNRNAPQLVLVQWSPSQMDWKSPPVIEAIAAHFQELMEHLSIGLGSICLWRPTKEKRQTFRVCVRYAGAAELRELVIESVEWCPTHLDDSARPSPKREPQNFSEANDAWRKSLREGNNQYEQEKFWSRRTEKLESDVLGPLRQHAENSPDPVERGLTMVLAELSGVLDPQIAMLSAKVEKLYAPGNVQMQSSFPPQEFEATLKLVDRVLATTKEIEACQTRKRFAPKNHRPSGNGSASPQQNSPR